MARPNQLVVPTTSPSATYSLSLSPCLTLFVCSSLENHRTRKTGASQSLKVHTSTYSLAHNFFSEGKQNKERKVLMLLQLLVGWLQFHQCTNVVYGQKYSFPGKFYLLSTAKCMNCIHDD